MERNVASCLDRPPQPAHPTSAFCAHVSYSRTLPKLVVHLPGHSCTVPKSSCTHAAPPQPPSQPTAAIPIPTAFALCLPATGVRSPSFAASGQTRQPPSWQQLQPPQTPPYSALLSYSCISLLPFSPGSSHLPTGWAACKPPDNFLLGSSVSLLGSW